MASARGLPSANRILDSPNLNVRVKLSRVKVIFTKLIFLSDSISTLGVSCSFPKLSIFRLPASLEPARPRKGTVHTSLQK